MPFFRVLIEGKNLCIPPPQGQSIVGFFTTRVVWSRTEADAQSKALRLVKELWSVDDH